MKARSLDLRTDALNYVERMVARLKGQGWGAETSRQEVATIAALVKTPRVVFDVGGHVGDWTAHLLKGAYAAAPPRVVIIEPNAGNAAKLRARFADQAGVTVIQAALSADDGEAVLFTNKLGSTRASIQKKNTGANQNVLEEVVATRSVPSLMSELGIEAIDVLKMDIEGHEFAVLSSIPDAVLARIKVIQFEFGGSNIESRIFFRDFWQLLSARFDFFRVTPLGLVAVKRYRVLDERFTVTNYVCRNRGSLEA